MQHLTGRRKRDFMQKWQEYEEKYYQVKNLGVLGMCMAIAPSVEELEKAKSSPHVMDQWELDRSKELHKIVHDLLQIAKKKNMA